MLRKCRALVRRDAATPLEAVEVVGVGAGEGPLAVQWDGRTYSCVMTVRKAPGVATEWIGSFGEEVTNTDSPEHAADLKFPLCLPLYSQKAILLVGLTTTDVHASVPFAFGGLPDVDVNQGEPPAVAYTPLTLEELQASQALWAATDPNTVLSEALDTLWKAKLASAVTLDEDGSETFVAEDDADGLVEPDVEISLAFSHLHQQPSYGQTGNVTSKEAASCVSGGVLDDEPPDDGTDLLDIDTHTGLALETGHDIGDEDEMESIEGSEEEDDDDDEEDPVADDEDAGDEAP